VHHVRWTHVIQASIHESIVIKIFGGLSAVPLPRGDAAIESMRDAKSTPRLRHVWISPDDLKIKRKGIQ